MNDEQKTISYYDKHAAEWSGARNGKFWLEELEKFKRYLPNGKIFEVGSGAGRDAKHLNGLGYEYIGTDISDGLLEVARKENPDLEFQKKSVYELDFNGKIYDGFWAVAILLHIPKSRVKEALDKIKSNLCEGAIGLVSIKKGNGESVKKDELGERFFAYYRPQEFRAVLEQSGFEVLEMYEKLRNETTTFLVFFVKNH